MILVIALFGVISASVYAGQLEHFLEKAESGFCRQAV